MPKLVTIYESQPFTAEITNCKSRCNLCCFLCDLPCASFENGRCLHLPSKAVPNQFQQCALLVRDSTITALTVLINPEEYEILWLFYRFLGAFRHYIPSTVSGVSGKYAMQLGGVLHLLLQELYPSPLGRGFPAAVTKPLFSTQTLHWNLKSCHKEAVKQQWSWQGANTWHPAPHLKMRIRVLLLSLPSSSFYTHSPDTSSGALAKIYIAYPSCPALRVRLYK